MASDNSGRDERIVSLHERGWTMRAIATEVGISPTRVHQVVTAAAGTGLMITIEDDELENDNEEEDDEDGIGVDSLVPEQMAWPFVYVGRDATLDWRGRPARDSDGHRLGRSPRWLDARGHHIGQLDHFRYEQYLRRECDDREGAQRVRAQREADLAGDPERD